MNAKKVLNRNLNKAKGKKDDEFYTQLTDIEKELKHYKDHFKDKVVYCNCDDPLESNFFKYFILNFKHLGLKQLITTSHNPSIFINTLPEILEYDDDGIPKPNKFIINDVGDITGEFNLEYIISRLKENKHNEWAPLKGNGDFASEECIELLKQAHIVVTNPPFSLFKEYVAQLMQYGKKFLIIGNMNAIGYSKIFKLFKENKIWTGISPRGMDFILPNNDKKNVNACWFTNLSHTKRNEKLILYRSYNEQDYPKYLEYDAIEVSKTKDIPMDYDGYMGVPRTFFDKYNPDQFEIIEIGPANKMRLPSGKLAFARIIIRNKSLQQEGSTINEN